jgi:hypothetical protein
MYAVRKGDPRPSLRIIWITVSLGFHKLRRWDKEVGEITVHTVQVQLQGTRAVGQRVDSGDHLLLFH